MLKSIFGKGKTILLAVAVVTAMIPTSAFAADASQGVTQSMKLEQSISNPASTSIRPQSTASNQATVSAATITKIKAEELARKYVNIPEDYMLQSANLYSDQLTNGTRNVWGLSFIKHVNGKPLGSIYASIHADNGQLVSYSSYHDTVTLKPTYPLKVERDQAQTIAAAFIKEAAANYANNVQYNESYGVQLLPALTGEVRHSFRFDRLVNGIRFLDNYMDVTVDSEGYVIEYALSWDDTIDFPKFSSYLSAEQAYEKLRKASEPQLKYIITSGGQGKQTSNLSYMLEPFAIHAVTGKRINDSFYSSNGQLSEQPVTAKPLATKPKVGAISEQQAIAIVKASLGIPEGAELKQSSYNEHQNIATDQLSASWNFYWEIKMNGKESGSLWAVVNGQTGVIQQYNLYWNEASTGTAEGQVALDTAINTAIEVVKKQLPWLTNELYVIKPDPKQYDTIGTTGPINYYISFLHKVHGASVEYDSVSVTIDARTGSLRSFEAYIQPFTYPSTAPVVITKEKALDQWMNYYNIELTYRVVNEFIWKGELITEEKYNALVVSEQLNDDHEVEKNVKAELVYLLKSKPIDQQLFLDASNGQWRTYETGEVTSLERPKALDAEGHWAQHQLELMVAYKALDVIDGNVRPNEVIKRGELIKMLVIARNNGSLGYVNDSSSTKSASFRDIAVGSEYFSYVEHALQQNLIDVGDGSFNPEATVTREEMAELIVRALGYNSLAKQEHIFSISFNDADQIKNKGQAAIAVGLNIMSTTQAGDFQPTKQVKRAEAAVAFFRYLQSRAELQEAPLRM